MKILMVAGGELNEELLSDIYRGFSEPPFVIGIDKGCRALYGQGIHINLAVGDFDSVGEFYERVVSSAEEIIELNPVKDDTDTEAAVMQALKRKPEEVMIFGALGRRADHMLANIYLLGRFMQNDIPACIVDKCNRIRLIKNELRLQRDDAFGKYVSVIPYGDHIASLTLKGFKYKADGLKLDKCSSRGVSNEITDEVGIIITSDPAIVIESRD